MISIISATRDEISFLLNKISDRKKKSTNSVEFIEGMYLKTDLVIAISGVGIKRARHCTKTLIQNYSPDVIVSAGFAGALDPRLNSGDLVLSDWVMSSKLNKKIVLDNKLPPLAFSYSKGGLLTENSFINTKKEKLDLRVESSADIVDMETWGIAENTHEKNIRLISVKAVSDPTSSMLPRMEKIYGPDSNFELNKAFYYFKNRPTELINYLKFRFVDMRRARIRLNSFLEVLIQVLNQSTN